jgi:DNA-binding PadR family transcriptional regulator
MTLAYERLVTKLTKENLWLYILRMLSERSMYAYEIKKMLRERFGFSTATVTVYVVLHRMRTEGLIRVGKEMSVFGRPDRIYYEITEKGGEILDVGKKFLQNTLSKLS